MDVHPPPGLASALGAVALGALRAPLPRPRRVVTGRCSSSPLADPAPSSQAGARPSAAAHPGASTSPACAGRPARACRPRSARARAAAAGRAGPRCHAAHAADVDGHRPRVHRHRRRDPAPPARPRARPQAALRPRAPARARPPRPRVAIERAAHRPARELGRRPGPAALGPELRHGPGRVRPPHGHGRRLRARGVARNRARDRALPPRLQRLERHRLQLPRRSLRRDFRRPRGRNRRRGGRRPGAGLQQPVDRHRLPGNVHQPAARRAGHGGARAADRLEALAPRRPRPGRGDARSPAAATSNRYPNGTPVVFQRVSGHRDGNETTCPGEALYAQLPDLRARAARFADPGLGHHGPGLEPARRQPDRGLGPAALRRRLARRPAHRSRSSTRRPARPGRR